MKKRYLIAIIVLVVLIICLGAGLAFAYFFTDTFKSNKELFSKYIVQNAEIAELFNDKDLKTYSEKQNNTPYTSEGSIKTNVTFPDSSQSQMATALQNCNITFTGKADKANNYIYQNINANYSDSQSLNLELVQNNDVYAFKINDVVNKFIGVQNANLKELATKFGLDEGAVAQIPDKIELSEYASLDLFTGQESEQIKVKYINIILDNLTDDMFSREADGNNTIYTLTINENQGKKIILKLLETLKDDDLILNKTKYLMTNKLNLTEENANTYIEQFKTQIQSLLDEENTQLNNENFSESEIQSDSHIFVKVYVQKSNLVRTEIEFPEIISNTSATIDIHKLSILKSNNGVRLEILPSGTEKTFLFSAQKIKSASEIKYDFSAANGDEQLFELIIEFTGTDTNQVHESSEFSFEYSSNSNITLNNSTDLSQPSTTITDSRTKFVCKYNITKFFGVEVPRNDVPNENILLINTAPNIESVENLFTQIGTKFEQLNATKVSSLGLQSSDNPFMYYIPAVVPVISTNLVTQSTSELTYVAIAPFILQSSIAAMATTAPRALSDSQDTINKTDLSDHAVQTFNAKWQVYAGENKTASIINALYAQVISNNSSEELNGTNHKIAINGEFPNTVQSELSNDKRYTVTFSYDENGYINEVIYY